MGSQCLVGRRHARHGTLGLSYKTNLVWYKVRKGGGPDRRSVGFYFRNVTEMILFGVRGKNAQTLRPGRSQGNVIVSRKREHSRKPDEQYDRSVTIVRETRNGSVRFRVHKMRRRPWPSATRVPPASVPARTPRGTRTPAMTGRRVAWLGLSSPPALTRRTPTKRSALRLRGGVALRSSLTLPRFPGLLR